MSKVNLEEAPYLATRIKVHLRTLFRAINHAVNPYWHPTFNPVINLEDVCEEFGIEMARLYDVLYGEDDLMTTAETAALLGVHFRTIRKRGIKPVLSSQSIVRYSRLELEKWIRDNEEQD